MGVEVEGPRPATNSRRPPEVDRGHGNKQCDVGRGAIRSGTLAQVGPSGLTSDDQTLYGISSRRATTRALVPALDDVCPQPRSSLAACDFFVAVTARFRVWYVFVIMEGGCRRIIQANVTAHPTAEWTLQQFREAIPGEDPYRYVIHDRDSIYSPELDSALKAMGLRTLKTPFRAPQANAYRERLAGSIRRECLDFLIPLNEKHLRRTLKHWVDHYNRGRPHSSSGPGIPDLPKHFPQKASPRYRIPQDHSVADKPILGGLHHEYGLERFAA